MTKTLLTPFIILSMIFCAILPCHLFADKFFEDNDAFFLKYLKQDKFDLDTSASAIVLYESSSLDLYTSRLRIRKIIKVIKKSGVGYADIAIPLPGSRSGYYFTGMGSIHGVTYNLEGGKIKKQVIDADNVTLEKTGLINEKKIAMPAVREGSIIDYSYEIYGTRLSKWEVQEKIPKLYTRIEIAIPAEITIESDDNVIPAFFDINKNKKDIPDSLLPYCYTYTEVTNHEKKNWVRRNVSAFNDEPFMPGESNYKEIFGINIKSEHLITEDYDDNTQEYIKWAHLNHIEFALNSWDRINAAFLESFNFYRAISSDASIKERVRKLVGDDTSDLSIAKKIFRFVNDSITVSYNSMLAIKDASKVLMQRSGNSAEINFLLISLLKQAQLTCRPVILVTRDNGIHGRLATELPKYDYTICQLKINGEKYYLDASEKYNSFGRLPSFCLNGYARIIDRHDTGGVMLEPDMAEEKSLYAVTTTNNNANDYTLNFILLS